MPETQEIDATKVRVVSKHEKVDALNVSSLAAFRGTWRHRGWVRVTKDNARGDELEQAARALGLAVEDDEGNPVSADVLDVAINPDMEHTKTAVKAAEKAGVAGTGGVS